LKTSAIYEESSENPFPHDFRRDAQHWGSSSLLCGHPAIIEDSFRPRSQPSLEILPSLGFRIGAVLLAEVIGTAILVLTVFGATDKAADPSRAGVTMGFALAASVWMFGPISGASLNPARTWEPTLVSAVFSLTPFGNLWIYVVGPVLGGLLGAFLYDAFR